MKKIISFSLWGSNPKYCIGAIRNAELATKFYPEWICRFYVHCDVPEKYVKKLKQFSHVEIEMQKGSANWTGMFWRFHAISDPDVDIMISRDCDSRLNEREMYAVKEFEKSEYQLHIMRDHPHHGFTVLGGMFGLKKNAGIDMKKECQQFNQKNQYGTDYIFLEYIAQKIPNIKTLVHDPFFEKKDFPTKREAFEFVGEVFDENDHNQVEHTYALMYFNP